MKKVFGEHKVKRIEIGKVQTGINAVRAVLPKCRFDKDTCKQGIRALENYHKEYDDVKKVFNNIPCHDWSSHYSDSFRGFAVSYKPKEGGLEEYENQVRQQLRSPIKNMV